MSNNKQYYEIYKILKQLGFKSSLRGTKLLIKVILKAFTYNDYFNLNDIYSTISQETNLSLSTIKTLIFYSINHRKKDISKRNFENIFECEYDESYFTNKEIIEMIINDHI